MTTEDEGRRSRRARQRPALAGDRAVRRRGRGGQASLADRPPRAGSRPPSTAATCSPPSPPTWRSASRWRARRADRSGSWTARARRAGDRARAQARGRGRLRRRFGNATLRATAADAELAGLRVGQHLRVSAPRRSSEAFYGHTFAEVEADQLLVYAGASGSLALAINLGSAADVLTLTAGERVALTAM